MAFDHHIAVSACALSGLTAVVVNVITCFHTIHTCLAAFTHVNYNPSSCNPGVLVTCACDTPSVVSKFARYASLLSLLSAGRSMRQTTYMPAERPAYNSSST